MSSTKSTRFDIRLSGRDRATLESLRASLASPHLLTPPTAADVIRAALSSLQDRVAAPSSPAGVQ